MEVLVELQVALQVRVESGGWMWTLFPGLDPQNLQVRCSAQSGPGHACSSLFGLFGQTGPSVPLRANRTVFLPLWNNVDYSGEVWREAPPTQDEEEEEEEGQQILFLFFELIMQQISLILR